MQLQRGWERYWPRRVLKPCWHQKLLSRNFCSRAKMQESSKSRNTDDAPKGRGYFLPIACDKSNSFCHKRSQKIKDEIWAHQTCAMLSPSKEACLPQEGQKPRGDPLTWSVGRNASSTWWEFLGCMWGSKCTRRQGCVFRKFVIHWAAASPQSLPSISKPCTLRGVGTKDRHDFDNLGTLPRPAQIRKSAPRCDVAVVPSLPGDVILAWPWLWTMWKPK